MRPTRQEERRELLAEAGDDLSLRTAAGLYRESQAALGTADHFKVCRACVRYVSPLVDWSRAAWR